MSLLGFDAVGRPAIGQISQRATVAVPVISDVTQEQPQLRGTRDRGRRIALAASGEFRVILPVIPSFGWFAPLGLPTTRPKLKPFQQQASTFDASFNFVPKFFFAPLSEPVRVKRPLREGDQQFLAYGSQNPIVSFGWFGNLSDPVRIKPGLKAALQRPFTTDTDVIPISKLIQWYANLSEPVRIKPGLKAAMQQFMASPSRLIPTPTSFGILDALETKDTLLAGAMVWNRVTDAEIGVINTTPKPAEIGLYQTAPAAGTITVRISIIIG